MATMTSDVPPEATAARRVDEMLATLVLAVALDLGGNHARSR